jgi:nucleolar protein 56
MKTFIVQFPFGVAAFDETNSLVEKALFAKKPQAAAKALLRAETGKLSDQATSLVNLLKNAGYDTFVFESATLAQEAQKRLKVTAEAATPAQSAVLHSRMAQVALESGFAADESELNIWNRNVAMELAKLRIKGAVEKRDLIVAQGIQTLDSLDQTVNLFMGRLREWYGIYFPELDRLVEKHETYARLVTNLGVRDNFTVEGLEAENIPKERTQVLAKAADASMGADISESDLEQVQALAQDVLAFYELRKSMEEYVDRTMAEMAPNVRAVAGALLGARMIAMQAAYEPCYATPSTIQCWRRKSAISQPQTAQGPQAWLNLPHTLLHTQRWQRGKIARVIAGKLAIAARADAFSEHHHYIGDQLKEEINKRIEEIREKYKEPPTPKEPKPREERREGSFDHREGGGERRFDRRDRPPRREGGGGFKPRDRGPRRQGGGKHFSKHGGGRNRNDRRGGSGGQNRGQEKRGPES